MPPHAKWFPYNPGPYHDAPESALAIPVVLEATTAALSMDSLSRMNHSLPSLRDTCLLEHTI